jgi:hypothetical protein
MSEQPTHSDHDLDLAALFQRSREEEVWPEPANAASMIWWRAQAADLVAREIRRREWLVRPLAKARIAAGIAALAAVELSLFQGGLALVERFPAIEKTLAGAGFSPLTAAVLTLAIPPTLALLHRFRTHTSEMF